MTNWAKIGVGAGALYVIYRIAVQNLVVGIQRAFLYGLNIEKGIAAVQLNVSLQNPLPFGVTVKNIVGTVYAGGVPIGTVNTTLNYYVGGAKVHILPVIVNLTADGMGQAVWQNIQTGNINNLVISFDGKIHATKLNIGIPLQFDLKWSDLV